MNVKYPILLTVFSFTSCAHYFSKEKTSNFTKKDQIQNPICISVGENSFKNQELAVFLEESHATHGKIITLIRKKYSNLVYDCASDKKTTIYYSNSQEKKQGDYFILSLGIIPLIAETAYNLKIYDYNNNLLYQSHNNGKVILSIFFIPFFFLHKDDNEIIFDEIDKYLQEAVKN